MSAPTVIILLFFGAVFVYLLPGLWEAVRGSGEAKKEEA